MATPYVTPAMLLAQPAGLAWNMVPTLTADTASQQAQLAQECWKATSAVDRYLRQPARATLNVAEMAQGPGMPRVFVGRGGCRTYLVTRRWPVVSAAAVQYSQSGAYPDSWNLVPANSVKIRNPVQVPASGVPVTSPSGGNTIDVQPGYITWDYGRGGWDLMTSYVSGHGPHTSLTADAAQGADSLEVDDVTGWAGWSGFAYDSTQTEGIQVDSVAANTPVTLPGVGGSVQAGPGTLTLASPLAYGHAAGTVISGLPADIIQASALQAAVQALLAIDAIATQSLSGRMSGGTGALAEEVEMMLDDWRRVF